MTEMGKQRKMTAILKRIGEIKTLLLCMAVWDVLFSIFLLLSGNVSYLSGFLLGAAGSVIYVFSLHRRLPAMLARQAASHRPLPQKRKEVPAPPASLKLLLSGWMKTMQPVAAVVLIILAVSHFFHSVSFTAALFGFFSFQISLFIYAALISIDQLFR